MKSSTHAGTPVNVRSSGVELSERTEAWIHERTGRQLEKFAGRVQRVTYRFEDVNGPRGGRDTLCRAKVMLKGLPTVVVEERARTARRAFNLVAPSAKVAVQKALDRGTRRGSRAGRSTAPKHAPEADRRETTPTVPAPPRNPKGSLIGRRVGQATRNLRRALARPEKRRRDVPVDTSLPGVSATDRKVGLESTATRNTKRNRRGMAFALEDSATGKPSRKSTRRSENRAKAGGKLSLRETQRVTSPKRRARRASARAARTR